MTTRKTLHIAYFVAALAWAATFVSCQNDVNEVDRVVERNRKIPTEIDNYSMVRCDSGYVTMRMSAGRVVIEQSEEDPEKSDRHGYDGVVIMSIKPGTDTVDVKMTADAAIEHAVSGLSEAIGNVIVSTIDGDSIMTERLIWDSEKHIFYTDHFARIVHGQDVMLPRKGFRADENFRWYELFNSSGEISIEDSLSTPSEHSSGSSPSRGAAPRRSSSSSSSSSSDGVGTYMPFPSLDEDEGNDTIPWQLRR